MKICSVIVTHNSAGSIRRLLSQLLSQTFVLDKIVVVDNASTDDTVEICLSMRSAHPQIDVIRHDVNLGGAGGFRVGFDRAMTLDSDYVLSMDDDVDIKDNNFIATMIDFMILNGVDVASALVIDPENHHQTAFKYRLAQGKTFCVSDIVRSDNQIADLKLFNGVLFSKKLVQRLKGPDPRFFIRGDEEAFRLKIVQSGFRFLVCKEARLYHPQSISESVYFLGKRLQSIDHKGKLYFSTRNRNYIYVKGLNNQHSTLKKLKVVFVELFYYAAFYLLKKRDLFRFLLWLRAWQDGISGNLSGRYAESVKKRYF